MDVYDTHKNLVISTNHYQGKAFINDPNNISNVKNSDSKFRFDRIKELVSKKQPVNVSKAISILRNKNGLKNKFIGYGNSKSLNQIIAYHSVVFKPTQHLIWVSTPPYQLGSFIAYNLDSAFYNKNQPFTYIDSLTIPADPFLKTKAYSNFDLFKKIKHHIQKKVMLNIPFDMNKKMENQFIKLNPKCYVTYMTLGEYHQKLKDYNVAIQYYHTALKYDVASKDEEYNIQNKIKECEKKLNE